MRRDAGEEREIKLRLDDPAVVRAHLERLGARREAGPARERNVLLDTADGRLAGAGCVLRLRRYGGRWRLTFKGGARFEGGVKVREELETEVEDGDALLAILGRLGFLPVRLYEKEREVWRLGAAAVCLDRTPMGWFVEVEGEDPEAVAVRLGLDPAAALRASYVALWETYRRDRPELGLPRDMVLP